MEDKEIFKSIITAGVIGTLAATIRALLAKNESPMQRVRTFFAGVFMAVLIGYILRDSALSNMWKEIMVGISGAFVSSFWPILENFVKKYLQKKGDDTINNNIS